MANAGKKSGLGLPFSFLPISTNPFVSSTASSCASSYVVKKVLNAFKCQNYFEEPDKVELIAVNGDLIEFSRTLYYHWGVYVGRGSVIHLMNLCDGNGKVMLTGLSEAADGEKCRVNNLKSAAARYKLKRKANNAICAEAYNSLDEIQEYDVTDWNCEHFATFCAYGRAFSEQAYNIKGNPIGSVVQFFRSSVRTH